MDDEFGWPIGTHLRFKCDAEMQEKYLWLRGTVVLVVGPLRFCTPGDGLKTWSLRQATYAYAHGRVGDSLPRQLEPLPDNYAFDAGEAEECDTKTGVGRVQAVNLKAKGEAQ